MEASYVIRKLITLIIWVIIGFATMPLASEKGRSCLLWYILGLAAYYIPFLLLTFGPILVASLFIKDRDDFESNLEIVLVIALPIAIATGVYCVRRLRKHLRSL